jgi:hypothetical protein
MNITVNPYKRFQSLISDGARTYGTITSVDTGGNTTLVTLQNGDQIRVKGSSYSPADRVLVADGEIRQKVQALPFNAIELF